MSNTHRTINTPDPRYRSLVVTVTENSFASNGGVIPVQGTKYKDFPRSIISSDYLKEFADFTYVQQLEDSKDGGRLVFARSFTDQERKTPFRTTTTFGNHRWPPILKSLKFELARDFPLNTQKSEGSNHQLVTANRYLVREVYIPEINEGTRFIQDEFISDIPFVIPSYPVPTPTSVTYHYLNIRGGFPECLHKEINISKLISTVSTFNGTATTNSYNELKGQIFPETNFVEWTSYVISDTQELSGGVWYRKRIRVYPPPMPKAITNIS